MKKRKEKAKAHVAASKSNAEREMQQGMAAAQAPSAVGAAADPAAAAAAATQAPAPAGVSVTPVPAEDSAGPPAPERPHGVAGFVGPDRPEGIVRTEAPEGGPFIKDMGRDEIRTGFLVDTGRKKLWNKQIELLMEIDRICAAHQIPYFSLIGTMLGVARHQGYVPWDDDLDIGMFRPDYERFKRAAAEEIHSPLYFQSAYTVDRQGMLFISKLRDDRTTAIGQRNDADKTGHQGIFIDIWPLDAFDDGREETKRLYAAEAEILSSIVDGQTILQRLQDHKTALKPEILFQLLQMQPLERFAQFEAFCAAHWHESENIGCFFYEGPYRTFPKAWFDEIAALPFEEIKLPTPVMYDEILTHHYMSDWHQIIRFPVHATVFSTDIPYKDYLEQVTQK